MRVSDVVARHRATPADCRAAGCRADPAEWGADVARRRCSARPAAHGGRPVGGPWGRVTATVTASTRRTYAATRAAGWCVRDLLFHQLLDAQRALVALASGTEDAADVDAVSYWAAVPAAEGDGGAGTRRSSGRRPRRTRRGRGWPGTGEDVAGGAARGAGGGPRRSGRTPGHVITVPTWSRRWRRGDGAPARPHPGACRAARAPGGGAAAHPRRARGAVRRSAAGLLGRHRGRAARHRPAAADDPRLPLLGWGRPPWQALRPKPRLSAGIPADSLGFPRSAGDYLGPHRSSL